MGGSQKVNTPQEVINYLNDLCAVALSLGMSVEEYWFGEPSNINYYIKADELKRKRINGELWLEGAYIYHALCCASPMFNGLAKDHKPKPYLKEPFALSQEEKEERDYERFKSRMFELANTTKK